jgi:hypothetical protein
LRAAASEQDAVREATSGARAPELEPLLDALRGASAPPRASEAEPPRALRAASPHPHFLIIHLLPMPHLMVCMFQDN